MKNDKIEVETIKSKLEAAQENMGQDKTAAGLILLDEAATLVTNLAKSASTEAVRDLCNRLEGDIPVIQAYYAEYHSLLLLDKYPEANLENTMGIMASYIHDNFEDCHSAIDAIEWTQTNDNVRQND